MIVLALGPPVLAGGYVLSVGPAATLLQSGVTGQRGEDFLHWAYRPLVPPQSATSVWAIG